MNCARKLKILKRYSLFFFSIESFGTHLLFASYLFVCFSSLAVFSHVQAIDQAQALFKSGIGVNPRNNLNQTPLHIAVEEGQAMMVHFLLSQPGIDINVVDMSGNTVQSAQGDVCFISCFMLFYVSY
jgi:hypothetical protein